jgi:hypothetical protein
MIGAWLKVAYSALSTAEESYKRFDTASVCTAFANTPVLRTALQVTYICMLKTIIVFKAIAKNPVE